MMYTAGKMNTMANIIGEINGTDLIGIETM